MIYAYSGIPQKSIDETHTTTKGKPYSLNHNPKLVGSTNYLGQGASRANAQGWERDRNKFFSSLEQKNPDMFSRVNKARIQAKQSPIIDEKMVQQAPELKPYKGEELVHHHIGGDGQAVAAPRSVHPGFGGIHNDEKRAGITKKCQAFSDKCEHITQKDPKMKGKSVDEFHAQINSQSSAQSKRTPTADAAGTIQAKKGNQSAQITRRADTVRSQTNAGTGNNQAHTRVNAVRSQPGNQNTNSTAQARSNAARTQSSSGKASAIQGNNKHLGR